MAKAHITTRTGVSIVVEGTPTEVAEIVAQLKGVTSATAQGKRVQGKAANARSKPTLGNVIAELIDGGFFKKPKELSAIRNALQEHGHHYPMTTLSPVMLRLVRRRELRRLKDKKRWVYVGG
jgi:hypothetical protein